MASSDRYECSSPCKCLNLSVREASNYIRYKDSFGFPWVSLIHTTLNQVRPIALVGVVNCNLFATVIKLQKRVKAKAEITRGNKTLRQNTKHAPFSTKLVSSETNSLAVKRLALIDGKLATARIQN